MANELDELMDKDPLSLSKQDIDAIIAYQRKARANYESGVKPKKGSGEAVVPLGNIVASLLGQAAPTPAQTVKRRV